MRELLQYAATGDRDRAASPHRHLDFLDRQLGHELDSQLAMLTATRTRARRSTSTRHGSRRAACSTSCRPGTPHVGRSPGRPASRMGYDRTIRGVRDARPQARDRTYGAR